jgi:hypothetical protein
MSLDTRIDDLYKLPLSEFTAARNALAKTLSGDDAKRVRALVKPKLVPWTVNQLFWKARPVFDRLLKTGAALRAAQIAAITGRAADVRRAADAHRQALAAAVARAAELASAVGALDANALARMLEVLSLSASPSDHPGRWTEVAQPAGFEVLAGVQPTVVIKTAPDVPKAKAKNATRWLAEQQEAERREAERLEAERERFEAEVRRAEQAVTAAKAIEDRAREALDQASDARRAAEQALAAARKAVSHHT